MIMNMQNSESNFQKFLTNVSQQPWNQYNSELKQDSILPTMSLFSFICAA